MLEAAGLEYEVCGEGEPVLLIHGSQVAGAFLPLMAEPVLADRFRLIRYHRRGFAGSARHTGPFGIEQQARDALRLAQELGLERVHVVGHSYGAVTALQLALEAPSAVHSLVLLEPPATLRDEASAVGEALAPMFARYHSGDASGAVDAFMGVVTAGDWRADLARSVPGGLEQAVNDAATFFETEAPALQAWGLSEDEASRISQPVLYMIGSESGPLFERPKQLLLPCLPNAEEVLVLGLDHLLQMRDASLVADPVADFLALHPMRSVER